MNVPSFLKKLQTWVKDEPKILAIILVGSHARNEAKQKSDIDLIIICDDCASFPQDQSWVDQFGLVTSHKQEDWGLLQAVRVFFVDGLEVEFGFTSPEWLTNKDSREILLKGNIILFDRQRLAEDAIDDIEDKNAIDQRKYEENIPFSEVFGKQK